MTTPTPTKLSRNAVTALEGEGFLAQRIGMAEADCIYPVGTQSHMMWQTGYQAAQEYYKPGYDSWLDEEYLREPE